MATSFDDVNVGDRVEVIYRGVVKDKRKHPTGYEAIDFGPCGSVAASIGAYSDTIDEVRVIERAKVPFVVGELLTPEMGEPPADSVILNLRTGTAWQRSGGRWVSTYSTGLSHIWTEFEPPVKRGNYRLLHLGE